MSPTPRFAALDVSIDEDTSSSIVILVVIAEVFTAGRGAGII